MFTHGTPFTHACTWKYQRKKTTSALEELTDMLPSNYNVQHKSYLLQAYERIKVTRIIISNVH
jgi:hypothetical protein